MSQYGEQAGLFSLPSLSDDYAATAVFPRAPVQHSGPSSFPNASWEDSLLSAGPVQAPMHLSSQALPGRQEPDAYEGFHIPSNLETSPSFPQQFGGSGRSLPVVCRSLRSHCHALLIERFLLRRWQPLPRSTAVARTISERTEGHTCRCPIRKLC
jgi:hypothetical protein